MCARREWLSRGQAAVLPTANNNCVSVILFFVPRVLCTTIIFSDVQVSAGRNFRAGGVEL